MHNVINCHVKLAGLIMASLIAATPAYADVYVGGSLGYAMGSAHQNNALGLKGFAGYGFNRYLAIEGGYADLGSQQFKPSGDTELKSSFSAAFLALKGSFPINQTVTLFGKIGLSSNQVKTSGSVTQVAQSNTRQGIIGQSAALEGIGDGAKVNSNARNTEIITTAITTTSSRSFSAGGRKISPLIGVGAEIALAPQLGLRVEYENFGKVTVNTANGDQISRQLSMVSTGLTYTF